MIDPIVKATREEIIAEARKKIGRTDEPQNAFRPDPETLQLFYPDETFSIDLPTGTVLVAQARTRPVLFEVNQLHLNAPKGIRDLHCRPLRVHAHSRRSDRALRSEGEERHHRQGSVAPRDRRSHSGGLLGLLPLLLASIGPAITWWVRLSAGRFGRYHKPRSAQNISVIHHRMVLTLRSIL